MTTWTSAPVLPDTVQVRIQAMHAAVTERQIVVADGVVLPEDASEWTRLRAASWERWLWTASEISSQVRRSA